MGGRGWGCWRPPPHPTAAPFPRGTRLCTIQGKPSGERLGAPVGGADLAHQGSWGPRAGLGTRGKWTISPAAWSREEVIFHSLHSTHSYSLSLTHTHTHLNLIHTFTLILNTITLILTHSFKHSLSHTYSPTLILSPLFTHAHAHARTHTSFSNS